MKRETENLALENLKAKCKDENDKAATERRALLTELTQEEDKRVALEMQMEELRRVFLGGDTVTRRCDQTPTGKV